MLPVPNWDQWEFMATAPSLPGAVLLSLNIDPVAGEAAFYSDYRDEFEVNEEHPEFDTRTANVRLRIARSRTSELEWDVSDPRHPKPRLLSFARLAELCDWPLPSRFPGRAPPPAAPLPPEYAPTFIADRNALRARYFGPNYDPNDKPPSREEMADWLREVRPLTMSKNYADALTLSVVPDKVALPLRKAAVRKEAARKVQEATKAKAGTPKGERGQ
jgi:hypothetical protein